MSINFISAICTPLDEQERLDRQGLETHLSQQWEYGASGVLLGGTMGLMQLLSDATYRDLIAEGAKIAQGKMEILAGVGDTSLTRTKRKIEIVSDLPIDGVVVLTPYFFPFGEEELCGYFRTLADVSKKPMYIYYLPQLTKVELQVETILKLAEHPNIHGIKSSSNTDWTMQLFERVPADFRVIVSAPFETRRLAMMGVTEFLDGVYAVFPKLSAKLLQALRDADWDRASQCEALLSKALEMLRGKFPLFGATAVILNHQGVSGKCNVSPLASLSPAAAEEVLNTPEIRMAIAGDVDAFTKAAAAAA